MSAGAENSKYIETIFHYNMEDILLVNTTDNRMSFTYLLIIWLAVHCFTVVQCVKHVGAVPRVPSSSDNHFPQ